jgi:cytidine deaminase
MSKERLVKEAIEAAENAYAPYSSFRVGAALLTGDGTVFRGVNVENRSYGLAICAERSAVSAALTAGKKNFQAIAVFSPEADVPLSPCGACRQVLSEFLAPDAPVYFISRTGAVEEHTMKDILPFAFTLPKTDSTSSP